MNRLAALFLVTCASSLATAPLGADAIPAFARRYRTSCSTCHTAPPKLNVLGEAFRLNGYRMPLNEALLRREETLALGAEPWRDLWPRAIWPGEIPAAVPLSLRLQLDSYVARSGGVQPTSNFEFPHELYFLAGTTLGDGVSAFLEATWSRTEGTEIAQAKVSLQRPLDILPPRALNLVIGLQDLYPFTLASREIDRAGRQEFHWQTYQPSEIVVRNAGGQSLQPLNAQAIGSPQAAIVAQGLIAPQVSYTAGIAQGGGESPNDNNNHKDLYYTVRWKIGGLRLDGTYPSGLGPVLGGHGQLQDRALVIEHFAYWGAEPATGGGSDAYRTAGIAARLLQGPLDLGAGYVVRSDDVPFGTDAAGSMRQRSIFGKAEYAFFPWLFGSLKAERFDVDVPDSVRALGYTQGRFGETRVIPGVYALLRQNVRAVLEAELYARHESSAQVSAPRPATLWLRLDLAF